MTSANEAVAAEPKAKKFEPLDRVEASHYEDCLGSEWKTIYEHDCDFDANSFFEVAHYLVRNPNINSSNLFRADILYDSDGAEHVDAWLDFTPEDLKAECPNIQTRLAVKNLQRRVIRRFIPRNEALDKPINQSVFYYRDDSKTDTDRAVVVMVPHILDATQMPFYHPNVAGLAFIYTAYLSKSRLSIAFRPFTEDIRNSLSSRQLRTAYHLLRTVWKHGQGKLAGYKKRVHHDQIIPQKRVQDRFADLKRKYAKRLISKWVEVTDPAKQVFEQIAIAAFLLELWADIYVDKPFPGFVDIGCGNGVLMEILLCEGYEGWGIEGHQRRTWQTLSSKTQKSLVHGIIVPAPLDWLNIEAPDYQEFGLSSNPRPDFRDTTKFVTEKLRSLSTKLFEKEKVRNTSSLPPFHNGLFNDSPETTEGPFLISNHADELTGWTPFLALLNRSSFFAVPCCSRNLSGERFRAPSHGNNWTADLSAPQYFRASNGDKLKPPKKHIAIALPGDVNEIGSSEDAQPLPTSRTASISSSASTADPFLASKTDDGQKYRFVSAASLANSFGAAEPSSPKSSKPSDTSTQVAETGDLKKLSQKSRAKGLSGYQALCCWVIHLSDKCGYLVEQEMLRLPSTRNFGIIGRFIKQDLQFENHVHDDIISKDLNLRERMAKVLEIIQAEGGAERSKWVSVCEKEIVKGNDVMDHEK